MKHSKNDGKKLQASTGVLLLAPLVILGCLAAMNGGTSLSASAFDALVAALEGILTSSWTILLVIIALISCIWTLAHGGGYRGVSVIIGILALALVGPGFVTSMATAMPSAEQMKTISSVKAPTSTAATAAASSF